MERPVLRPALLYDLQQRRCPIKPKRAQAHLKHRPTLRVHGQGANIDIEAGLVDVADRVIELAQGGREPLLIMLPAGVYGVH